jgi:hypothetical protein
MKTMGLAVAVALVAAAAGADVWDVQDQNDDTVSSTRTDLRHGVHQAHDLAVRPGPVPDEDWYLVYQYRDASYEVVVDGVSGDAINGLRLERLAQDGTTVIQNAPTSLLTRYLRWANTGTHDESTERIRVAGAACGTGCDANDGYTIRLLETTVYLPRFNNSGTQGTVLLLQGAASHQSLTARLVFRTAGGTLLHVLLVNVPLEGGAVVNLASISQLAGQSGHVVIGHDGGYGGLTVKAVAIEPATGFTFDTAGVSIPH